MTRPWRAAIVALIVLAAGLVLPWPGPVVDALRADPAPPGPSLPAQFPSYAPLTASAFGHPAGRAIALYEFGSSELFTSWQTLVAGADRDTYRTLALAGNVAPAVLLAPDGSRVLFHTDRPGTDEFTLLDLGTGATRVLHSVTWSNAHGYGVRLLAWSADGRYVAYTVPTDWPPEPSFEQRPVEDLAILDVQTDTTQRFTDLTPVLGAAFAPSGDQLAVQLGHDGWLVSVTGARLRPLRLPTGADFGSGVAWSPDGFLIATYVEHIMAPAGTGFVDATGSGRSVPAEFPIAPVLGWRTPTSVLVQSYEADTNVIAEVSIADGRSTVRAAFSRTQNCEFGLQRCDPYRIQLATALLGSVQLRPSQPDRGPWSPIVHTAIAALVALIAGLLVLRLGRSRRPGASPAASTTTAAPALITTERTA